MAHTAVTAMRMVWTEYATCELTSEAMPPVWHADGETGYARRKPRHVPEREHHKGPDEELPEAGSGGWLAVTSIPH